jgi:NRAMP (natural resistance-associated macrophage protein)-like metal ion transporter
MKKYFGPSTLVAAAFIGPGTLTICTLTGVNTGYTLLWALVFSIIATTILQEMAARLGLITQAGLGEAISEQFKTPVARAISVLLVISAIVIGNGAYEAGNIAGSVLGTQYLFGVFETNGIQFNPLFIGLTAFFLLNTGKYKTIEKFLIALVLIMSITFVITAIVIQPDLGAIFKGMFVPQIPTDSMLLVIGLIGTTVVPYNLFLHASSVSQKWKKSEELKDLRIENIVAILLGGIISMCIVITSASAFGSGTTDIKNAADMAVQLEPILGSWSKYFMAMGLFAAGITSAITAPLAAAMATAGLLRWKGGFNDKGFKAVWMFILALGTIMAMLNFKSIEIIQFAQVANGILLPIIAGFLLYISNQKSILGKYTNSMTQNVLGLVVIAVTLFISFRSLNAVFGFM